MRVLTLLSLLALAACSDKPDDPEFLDAIIFLPDARIHDLPPPDRYLPCREGCHDIIYIKRCETNGKWKPSVGHCPPQRACGKCVTQSDAGLPRSLQPDPWAWSGI